MRGGWIVVALALSGCVGTHRVVAPIPVTGSEEPSPAIPSSGRIFGQVVKPVVAERCQATNALSEVRIETSLGQALATVLTLGLWQPVRVRYLCAKEPTDVEEPARP